VHGSVCLRVALMDWKPARRDVEKLSGKALVILVDVADANQVEAAAAQVEAEFGEIDIWINNAMTSVFSPIIP